MEVTLEEVTLEEVTLSVDVVVVSVLVVEVTVVSDDVVVSVDVEVELVRMLPAVTPGEPARLPPNERAKKCRKKSNLAACNTLEITLAGAPVF